MIPVPISTPEKPLTAIDFAAALEQCSTISEVRDFGERVPIEVRQDERFTKAVALRLAAIKSINRKEKR